jgi:hypothetical protein
MYCPKVLFGKDLREWRRAHTDKLTVAQVIKAIYDFEALSAKVGTNFGWQAEAAQ